MRIFLTLLLFCASLHASTLSKQQQRMLGDLKFIKNAFAVKYAPAQWKKDLCGWDLNASYEKAKASILATPEISLKQFHHILKQFFLEAKDYHVSINFFSTEEATLPFLIKSAGGRYFVVYVDDEKRHLVEVGDEVISFDGRAIDEVIAELKTLEMGNNSTLTDQTLAEITLTQRLGARGDKVPQGSVDLEVRKSFTGKRHRYCLQWDYQKEKIRECDHPLMELAASKPHVKRKVPRTTIKESFFHKRMVCPFWETTWGKDHEEENPFILGSKKSYLPALGKKVWEAKEECDFDAYIFTMPSEYVHSGKNIGYLRIPCYCGDEEEVVQFKEIIEEMEKNSDALIIDQINNPGGNLFYTYALISLLTDHPLLPPKHHLALTQHEVYTAVSLLDELDSVVDDASAQEMIGENLGGYPITLDFASNLRRFCDCLIEEWNQGKLYTKLTHLFGIDTIDPYPETHYTKPILVLINELDFSGGDFFPAILQDNQRAILFGTKTAGAGGYVYQNSFANFSAITGFSFTASLARRFDQQPIENRGVTPDICYEVTEKDLKEEFCEYAHNVLEVVEKML